MRLFFAFELDEPTRYALQTRLLPVKRQVPARWTKPENLHLTLQFLGEQPPAAVPGLTEALDRAAADARSFAVSFSGFGTFRAASGLLWVGVTSGPEPARLVRQLRRQLLAQGFPAEERPWQPHLTVAREVRLAGTSLPPWPSDPICSRIGSVSLMESVRLDGRLVYRPLYRVQLTDKMTEDRKEPNEEDLP